MKHATIFSTAALCLLLSFNVSAAYIVDTGPGRPALLLSQEQWLAAEFTLDQAYTITGIEGWLQYFAGTSSSFAPFDISIYADGGDIPDAGNRIFNAIFSTGVPPQPVDWYGRAGGLSLDLSAGTYWLAFEMDGSRVPPEYGYGDMPPTPTQVLANYAVWNPTTGWVGDDTATIAVRIAGSPVPVPPALPLTATALAAFAWIGRRRKKYSGSS